jgi:hypothetical protein
MRNTYYVMRHGKSEANERGIVVSSPVSTANVPRPRRTWCLNRSTRLFGAILFSCFVQSTQRKTRTWVKGDGSIFAD